VCVALRTHMELSLEVRARRALRAEAAAAQALLAGPPTAAAVDAFLAADTALQAHVDECKRRRLSTHVLAPVRAWWLYTQLLASVFTLSLRLCACVPVCQCLIASLFLTERARARVPQWTGISSGRR
jgi:hypothetical protein